MNDIQGLFEGFYVYDGGHYDPKTAKPIYLQNENISEIPTDILRDRFTVLSVILTHLHDIQNMMDICNVYENEDEKVYVNGLPVPEDGHLDNPQAYSLMASHYGAQKSLFALIRAINNLVHYGGYHTEIVDRYSKTHDVPPYLEGGVMRYVVSKGDKKEGIPPVDRLIYYAPPLKDIEPMDKEERE